MTELPDVKVLSDEFVKWLKEKEVLVLKKNIGHMTRLDIQNVRQKNITYRKHESNNYYNMVSIEGNKNGMQFSFTIDLTDVISLHMNEDECCLRLNDDRKIFIRKWR